MSIFNFLTTNFNLTGGKYLIIFIFDIQIKADIFEHQMCQISINSEHF